MRHALQTTSVLVGLLLAEACATGSSAAEELGANGPRSFITSAEIGRGQFPNAYDAIRTLRPGWLGASGFDTIGRPGGMKVLLDDIEVSGPDPLRSFSFTRVDSMQWFDGPAAVKRWGRGYERGAILVRRR
jgi:hypothetical protein